MADPDVYSRDYSFTDFQADSPASPLPGNKVDEELNDIAAVTVDIVAAITDVRRSDGALKNGIVTEDSLADDVLTAFQDQVDAAEGFADAAAASAAAAASDETAADAHRVAAAASASSASTSASTATTQAATATTKAGEASTSAATATTQAGLASTSAATATTQAGTATTQAGIATTQAGTATTQAGIATTQAGIATTQAGLAATLYDSFDDRYLGPQAADPTLDNDGNALLTGALYYNSVSLEMRVWSGSAWAVAYVPVAGYAQLSAANTFTADQTVQFSDDGATAGPTLNLTRVSASPAANDLLGLLNFRGRDSVNADTIYARIQAQLMDPVNGSEDGRLVFYCMQAGTLTVAATLQLGLFMPGTSDQGVGTISATTLYEGTTALSTKYAALAATATQVFDGSTTNASPVEMRWSDAGAGGGPWLDMRRNGASPAAADRLGAVRFIGRDSVQGATTYALLEGLIIDPTDGTEDGAAAVRTLVNGTEAVRATFAQGLYMAGQSDQGAGTVAASEFYDDGVALSAKYAALAGAVFVGGVTSTAFTEGATLLSAKYALASAIGTIASQAASAVAITGGTISGLTSLAAAAAAPLTLTYVDAGALVGPTGILYRNSASPAAADITGSLTYRGKDSGGNDTDYAHLRAIIDDPTDGSEDGHMTVRTTIAGTAGDRFHVGAGAYTDGLADMGAGTFNATAYYRNGVIQGVTPTIQVITGSGTWNRPAGCTKVKVTVIGGGGGGGGADGSAGTANAAGGGGGGGGHAIKYIDVSALSSASVTVGAAGTAGTNAGGSGGAGGTSSFGTGPLLQATGGAGGTGVQESGTSGATAGGAGGVGTLGDINGSGGGGGPGLYPNPAIQGGGVGGSSIMGGGGAPPARTGTGSTAGGAGGNYGGGGAGAVSNTTTSGAAGGLGGAGVVIVEEFY